VLRKGPAKCLVPFIIFDRIDLPDCLRGQNKTKMTPEFLSAIVSQSEGEREDFEWGSFIKYFTSDTLSIKDVLVGVALIKPGHEIHPPHQHIEEEYLMVTEGEGEWMINGEIRPAKPGDILYTAPWEWHGITNTGETTMTFVVWKWLGKGVEYPENMHPES